MAVKFLNDILNEDEKKKIKVILKWNRNEDLIYIVLFRV